ncbi:MAG: bifunctional hydroxymethylpyrimidine kinase/phosphomethylpyrimidine kinase [Planctomycetota bacterium]
MTSLADRFWASDLDLAEACARHPFVRGLADGTLPSWRYRDYVGQDAFFLRAFAQAYRLAAQNCGDDDGRALYARLSRGVDEELQLHRGTATAMAIDLDRIEPTDATLAYVEFLLATAATRPEPCAAAAMLPCLRLYAFLGERLLPALAPKSPFTSWVKTYAAPEFSELWRALAPRLDRADARGPASDELARLHRRAMHLEHRFFAAAWGGDAPQSPRLALTIAGSDPSGGAGIQADLKTFHRFGVYGQSALTLLTAQNTRGVQGVFVEPVAVVLAQLRSVMSDLGAHAAKTGALGSVEIVAAVADELGRHRELPLVVDPVLTSKHGHALASPDVARAVRERLLPIATVVTPNRFEAEAMTGTRVVDLASARTAAEAILAAGARSVVIKDVPFLDGDLLHTGEAAVFLQRPHVETRHRHGSGCTFSAAITAELAKGRTVPEAVDTARDFVVRAIASAPGFSEVGPLNHWA